MRQAPLWWFAWLWSWTFVCQIAKLKQQLQRTKLSGRAQRSCPLQGDHAVLAPLRVRPPLPLLCSQPLGSLSSAFCSQA